MENKMVSILQNFDKANKVYNIIFRDEYNRILDGNWCYLTPKNIGEKAEQTLFMCMDFAQKHRYAIKRAHEFLLHCKEMSWQEFISNWDLVNKFDELAGQIIQYIIKYVDNIEAVKESKSVKESKTSNLYKDMIDVDSHRWIIEKAIQFGIKLQEREIYPDDDLEELAQDFNQMLNDFLRTSHGYHYFSEYLDDNLTESKIYKLRRSDKRI